MPPLADGEHYRCAQWPDRRPEIWYMLIGIVLAKSMDPFFIVNLHALSCPGWEDLKIYRCTGSSCAPARSPFIR
jgi:hypothetical protein